MNWNFDNDKPIYLQIIDKLKMAIVSGEFQPGEKLPAVREFALQTSVNPNTMQKALTELEEYGIVYTQRTSGRFVTEDQKKLNELKTEIAKYKMNVFCKDMFDLGFSKNEILEMLRKEEMK